MSVVSSLRPVSGSAEEILGLLREWDAADDPEPLVIATSGSTGEPKRVVLSREAMRASALATHERLGGPGQWVLNLPPSYVAGVQVLYRSVVAGTEPVDRGRGPQWPPAYISLVPTQLVRMLRDMTTTRGRLDATVRRRADRRWTARPGRARRRPRRAASRIVQTYGMSETCGGCVYDGRPLDGVEVRDRTTARCSCAGRCCSTATRASPSGPRRVMQDGWFRTNDLGRLDDDGRLWVTGRADDVIISGGVKVPAAAVAAAISRRPATVRGRRGARRTRPGVGRAGGGLRRRPTTRSRWPDCATWSSHATWAPRQLVLVAGAPAAAQRQARPGAGCGAMA